MGRTCAAAVISGLVGIAVLASAAGTATATPTVQLVCDDQCVALEPVPDVGTVDVVVLEADHAPRLRSGATDLTFTRCGPNWCAKGVVLDGPIVHASAISATVTGADVKETPVSGPPTDDPETDPFEDAVLVGGRRGYRCSGVLLDSTHVLTAAHCAPATHVGTGARAETAVRVDVTRSELHPIADAAVLTLSRPLEAARHPRRTARDTSAPAGRLRIIGFGVRDALRFGGFGVRRQVDINVDGWGCPRQRAATLGCRLEFEMHMRDGAGNDTCFGDSGGPVYEETVDGWRLIAITSRGAAPRKVLCGEGGIYIRVDRLAPWLREVTTP